MKTKVRINFNGRRIPGGERAVLEPARCGPDVVLIHDVEVLERTSVYVTLDADDPRLPILEELLRAHSIDPLEGRWDEFTEAELDAAPLLIMAHDDVNEQVFGGPRLGTTYDMSAACPRCGAGARQTSAMFIDGEDLPKLEGRRASATFYQDMLVDEALAGALVEAGATGMTLRGVFATFEERGPLELPWRQVSATHALPRMSPRSTGIEPYKSCACGRSSFTNPAEVPLRLTYRATDVAAFHDVNVTWECYGEAKFNGDVSTALFPRPLFLITPKVRRIFLDAGVTGFDWIPIRVEDD